MRLFPRKYAHSGMPRSGRPGSVEPSLSGRVATVTDRNTLFRTMVRRLSPTLRRITRRLNPSSPLIGEQDLFQEALIQMWIRFTAGELDDKTDSYILQGCYFHLKNYLRKNPERTAIVSVSSIMEENGLEEIVFTDDNACGEYLEGTLQAEAMLSGMTRKEKEVLFLCLEGMTTREIGKRLGVSHVAVVKIRNRMKKKYESLRKEKGTCT